MKKLNLYLIACLFLLFSCKNENNPDVAIHKANSFISETATTPQTLNGLSASTTNAKHHALISWNIKDFGQTKDDIEIKAIATIVKDFDIVLIQEVVAKHPGGAQAVARLADQLNRMGTKWDYSISDPTQSPSVYMSERYAYLWKTAKVSLKGKPFLDKELSTLVYREPYIANFLFKGTTTPVTVINYHSRKHDDHPENEIQHFLEYNKRLKTNNILLCGDFNLNETHPVWNSFYKTGYKNAISNTPTTLKTKCKYGNYLNHAIDNIYSQGDFKIINANSLDFIKACDNVTAARQLSDHLPVFVEFIVE